MRSAAPVRDYYDRGVDAEWARLDKAWLEYGITRHFIDATIPRRARILDLGGGPGRYALDLAETGHQVSLVDLSPASIARAKAEALRRSITLATARVADARDLSGFEAASFDAVLALGPFYHLIDAQDRLRALRECVRVLAPDGVVFVAFLSRDTPIHFMLRNQPGAPGEAQSIIERIDANGVLSAADAGAFFTEAWFATLEQMGAALEHPELEVETCFGAESIMAQSMAVLAQEPEETRAAWERLAILHAQSKAALLASEHVVWVLRKR